MPVGEHNESLKGSWRGSFIQNVASSSSAACFTTTRFELKNATTLMRLWKEYYRPPSDASSDQGYIGHRSNHSNVTSARVRFPAYQFVPQCDELPQKSNEDLVACISRSSFLVAIYLENPKAPPFLQRSILGYPSAQQLFFRLKTLSNAHMRLLYISKARSYSIFTNCVLYVCTNKLEECKSLIANQA